MQQYIWRPFLWPSTHYQTCPTKQSFHMETFKCVIMQTLPSGLPISKSSSFHLCCLSPALPPNPPIPVDTASLESVLAAEDEVACVDDGLEPEEDCAVGSGLDPEPGLMG